MDIDMPDHQASEQAPSTDSVMRRRLLGAGVAGLAASLLPRVASRASAGTDEPAATTTTAPPKQPTSGDGALLSFAQSVELAAVELYDVALAGSAIDGDARAVFAAVREAHQAYAQSIAALIGRAADGSPLVDAITALEEGFSAGSSTDLALAAYDLEATAVATHTELIAQLEGTDGAELIASIMIVEARHCTVFATIAGETDLDTLLLSTGTALEPTEG